MSVDEAGLSLRVREPESFIPMMLQGAAAVLPEFAAIPEEERLTTIKRMKADLAQAVRPFVQGDVLMFDSAANVLMARR